MTRSLAVALCAFAVIPAYSVAPAKADDWPQWMGPNRDGEWKESGITRALPKGDPKQGNRIAPLWSASISAGYSGPSVADGKVYVTDRVLAKNAHNPADPFDTKTVVKSNERVLCLDAKTGQELWKHEYKCDYQISYPAGPRCTPTVHDGKVYTLGAMGHLFCLDAKTGNEIWKKHFPTDYGAKVPTWGYCGHPLVYKNLLICLVGGDKAVAVAFDKDTGNEKWKKLSARDTGYAPPTLIHAGRVDQVVIWHGGALNGLNPLTGDVYWTVPLEPLYGMSIMAPRKHGDRLFAAGIGGAAAVLKLDKDKPLASVVWQEKADKGLDNPKERGVYPVNMTPFIENGVIYGVDQPGMLRAVELETGKRLWFEYKPVIGRDAEEDYKGAGSGTAFVVKNGDHYFLFAETGDLVIAKLSPKGYQEVSRAKLLEPTGAVFGRKVVWNHPAFANKCVFVRNDKVIACFSLMGK